MRVNFEINPPSFATNLKSRVQQSAHERRAIRRAQKAVKAQMRPMLIAQGEHLLALDEQQEEVKES